MLFPSAEEELEDNATYFFLRVAVCRVWWVFPQGGIFGMQGLWWVPLTLTNTSFNYRAMGKNDRNWAFGLPVFSSSHGDSVDTRFALRGPLRAPLCISRQTVCCELQQTVTGYIMFEIIVPSAALTQSQLAKVTLDRSLNLFSLSSM